MKKGEDMKKRLRLLLLVLLICILGVPIMVWSQLRPTPIPTPSMRLRSRLTPTPDLTPSPSPAPTTAPRPASRPTPGPTPTPHYVINYKVMEEVHDSLMLWQLYYKIKEGQPLLPGEQQLFAWYANDIEKLQNELYNIKPRSIRESSFVADLDALDLDMFQNEVTKRKDPEKWYQDRWCQEYGGKSEVVLADGTRCDCIATIDGVDYAIEVGSGRKWTEAIGQALHYASLTKKTPGIALILEDEKEYKYFLQLNTTLQYHQLDVRTWLIQNYE
jgi:hypothetical protein